MTPPFDRAGHNPFEDDVVREPRDVSFSVAGLNDAPLEGLLQKFGALESNGVPLARPAKAPKVQLVVSPDRGYGKSHLLGRLFAKLGGRATRVYLRPFQDPNKAWHSILLLTVQELDHPEEAANASSQLEAFATGTLRHVIADDSVARLADADRDTEFRDRWLRISADREEIGRLSAGLARRHIELLGREKAWLKILAACAFDERYSDKRSAALKWLRAEPLEVEEVRLLHLDQADNEGRGESSAQEINNLSFQRLRGLCQLASYYRPFVFCFDQTEFYASDPALIKALGNSIDQLYAELPNHLTVITANQENWVTEIVPHLQPAHRNRIDSELRLEGIRIEGARELIASRLTESGLDTGVIPAFCAGGWLEKVFDPFPELGVRRLLTLVAERFREVARRPGSRPTPPPLVTLDDLFNLEVNNVRTKRSLMAYNQDALMWFVKDIGQGLENIEFGRPPGCRYFSSEWRWRDRRVAFGFEGGDHWMRWQAIAAEASRMARDPASPTRLSYVFRTPDLRSVPRPTWIVARPTLDQARSDGFRIVELDRDQVCEIHAARELYSNALQGNIDHSGPTALAWLRGRFAPFVKRLAFDEQPVEPNGGSGGTREPAVTTREEPPSPAAPIELDGRRLRLVLDLVREHRIVDISIVLRRLGNEELRDPLLRSVEAHPNLKAHPGPQSTFLQWRVA